MPNLELFRRTSAVELFRGILMAMAILLVAHIDPSVAQTTEEPGHKYIAAGGSHSLAVACDGRVYAWGNNKNCECGREPTVSNVQVPLLLLHEELPSSGAVEVVGGGYHSMAIMNFEFVYAWGANKWGQLGIGSHEDSCIPLLVDPPGDYLGVTRLAAGAEHSLAVRWDGSLWAWGKNNYGQLGIHSNDNQSVPYQVHGPGGEGYLTGIVDVAAGDNHSLALKSDGTVYAWGEGGHGQLGIHSDNDHTVPYQVHGPDNVGYLTGIIKVAAGANFSLALKDDGTLWSWGEGGRGQLGLHSNNDHTVPYQVHGPDNVGYLTDVVDVDGGQHHTLALKSDGTVYAWGANGDGQLGIHNNDDHTVPYQVHGPDDVGYLTGIIEVAAGDYFSLALRDDGTVWAWGEGGSGQLGVNSNNDHTIPYQVHGPDNVGYLTGIGPICSTPPPGGSLPPAPGTPPPGGSAPPAPGNPPTWRGSVVHELFQGSTEAFTEALVGNLEASGFQVSEGYPKLWTEADCAYSYPVYHNCFGNNPAAPYVVPVVKSWPDEYVDPAMVNGLGMTRPGYSATYRLDPREAIIWFGRMPPPARYIGLQSWIWTTGWVSDGSPWDKEAYDSYKTAAGSLIQYLFATVPPVNFATDPPVYGDRVQSVSSLDNNINNVVMEKQSGPPWDQMRYFVITPDQVTDQAVRDALVSLGVDEGEIFTERIPETFQDPDHFPPYPYGQNPVVGPLGLGKDAVDFFTNIRYAMPEDEQAAEIWREGLPMAVLRARRISGTPEPFEDRVADERTGVDEVADAALSSGLSSLIDAVIARAESQGLYLDTTDPEKTNPEEMRDLQSDLGNFGPACREIGMNCLGDNQDASYFLFPPKPLDTGRIYAVVSTLATETGNGTYVGLSVNDASLLKGVLNVDDKKLKGSAKSYVGEVPNPETLEKFFVHFFTRDCAAIAGLTDPGACTTITTDMVPLAGDDAAPGDPELHGMFSAAVRAYVARGSERGADPTLQLRPVVLTFY